MPAAYPDHEADRMEPSEQVGSAHEAFGADRERRRSQRMPSRTPSVNGTAPTIRNERSGR